MSTATINPELNRSVEPNADRARLAVMRTFVIPIILCMVLIGCASSPENSTHVEYSDGVDKREASIIAADYLSRHMVASLGHTGPYDHGAAWMFKITGDVVPFVLTNVPPVLVEKSTGNVTWDAKPALKK